MTDRFRELLASAPRYPQRIVCMTEETTETLYRIGAGDLVVGVSGFTVRPPEARKKPRVSSFLDANFERILELKPDVVLGFSDLQADLGRELCKRGVPVVLFNQRSLAEILQTVRVVGALVGRAEAAERLAHELEGNLARHAKAAERLPRLGHQLRTYRRRHHLPPAALDAARALLIKEGPQGLTLKAVAARVARAAPELSSMTLRRSSGRLS